jgi:hypothetical protein
MYVKGYIHMYVTKFRIDFFFLYQPVLFLNIEKISTFYSESVFNSYRVGHLAKLKDNDPIWLTWLTYIDTYWNNSSSYQD